VAVWIVVAILVLVGAFAGLRYWQRHQMIGPGLSPTPTVTASPTPNKQSGVYETEYLKVTIPTGWTAAQANLRALDYDANSIYSNPAAVNITKGDYILYINTQATLPEGSGFSQIAWGAPSVSKVLKSSGDPCGYTSDDRSNTYPDHVRVDYFINEETQGQNCIAPNAPATRWYFSYITPRNDNGSYINYYPGTNKLIGIVITMAHRASNVNQLPAKGSAELNSMLHDMTAIAATLQVKKTTVQYNDLNLKFTLTLLANWQGYTLDKGTWDGTGMGQDNSGANYSGTQIVIRNPKGSRWQPIPIMVFTPAQWQLVEQEKINLSAAPVGPSKIGQNAKYVFALPARWVGFADYYGMDEAMAISQTFKAY